MTAIRVREADRILAENRRQAETLTRRYHPGRPFTRYLRHSQERCLRSALERHGRRSLSDHTLLEVGCGVGNWIEIWKRLGGLEERVSGVDLDSRRIDSARERFPGADLHPAEATDLHWADGAFDLVFQSTVFTSILDPAVRRRVAQEMRRLVRDDGLILWYDFFLDNPWNRAVRGVGRGEIESLFPGCGFDARRVVLAPPLARALAPVSTRLCHALERLRVLNTFYFAVVQPSTGTGVGR